jgi:hypothetical protein
LGRIINNRPIKAFTPVGDAGRYVTNQLTLIKSKNDEKAAGFYFTDDILCFWLFKH